MTLKVCRDDVLFISKDNLLTWRTGYTTFLWNAVLGWPKDQYQVFLMSMRKVLRNRNIHGYMAVRYVYGRKPGGQSAPA